MLIGCALAVLQGFWVVPLTSHPPQRVLQESPGKPLHGTCIPGRVLFMDRETRCYNSEDTTQKPWRYMLSCSCWFSPAPRETAAGSCNPPRILSPESVVLGGVITFGLLTARSHQVLVASTLCLPSDFRSQEALRFVSLRSREFERNGNLAREHLNWLTKLLSVQVYKTKAPNMKRYTLYSKDLDRGLLKKDPYSLEAPIWPQPALLPRFPNPALTEALAPNFRHS